MITNTELTPQHLVPAIRSFASLASEKTTRLLRRWNTSDGAPVFTEAGRYTARGWTDWTQGFLYGDAILCFDLTGDRELLDLGRKHVLHDMAEHVTHFGVHDHGFNCISTYGNLRRLMLEGRIEHNAWEMNFYELALKASGSVQAARWTDLPNNSGYIYSFNGAHSLFVDTFRTLRILSMSHSLGHTFKGEQDRSVSLLDRMMTHARTSAKFNIYYGDYRDRYDTPELNGRTVHEAIFNPASGAFRCPSTQQGYSAFTTWTRGLAWAMLGATEEIEYLQALPGEHFAMEEARALRDETLAALLKAARATCDFYIEQGTARDGICYWDTGAPQLHRIPDWQNVDADPFNRFEPVDSSASAIGAQGLLRLGRILGDEGNAYTAAGLTVAARLLQEPYLSTKPDHEGLLLHSIYHQPNGWDYTPIPGLVPHGESCMWGDYHLLELSLLISRMADQRYYTFFQGGPA